MTEEYIIEESGETQEQEYKIDFAYIVGNDDSGYKVYLSDSRGLMDTPLNNYTVEEGLSFVIFITIWLVCICKFMGWCFKWIK